MKAKSLIVLSLVLGGMFAGAGSAIAEDDIAIVPKPVCAENEYIDFDAEGQPYCVEVSTAEETVGEEVPPCWVTEDGTDVCARGFVTGEEPAPIDETCTATINEDGTESFVCADWMASTGMVPGEDDLGAPLNDDGVIYEKSLMSSSVGESSNGTLAFLGLFFGLVGGAAIALRNKTQTK